MRYRELGRSGDRVSVVALGCGGFGGVGSEASLFGQGETEDEAFALMDAALAAGITYFDTANTYGGGRSEEMIGRWLKARRARDSIFLATKVGTPIPGEPGSGGLSRQHITAEIDRSLARLQTGWVDLYLAHQVDDATPIEVTLDAFAEVVRAGKARAVGVCNCEAWRLAAAGDAASRRETARFECVQNALNLLTFESQRDVLAAAAANGVAFFAHSPLAGGLLTGKYGEGAPAPAGSRLALRPAPYAGLATPATFALVDRLAIVAAQAGLSLPTLALAWVLADERVTGLVIGPRRPAQIADAIKALEHPLSADVRAAVDAALRHAGASP